MAHASSAPPDDGVVSRRSFVLNGCRLLLAWVFIYSAYSKWVSGPQGVELSLVTAGIRNPVVVLGIARALPLFEILLGVWLAAARVPTRPTIIAIAFLGAMTSFLILLGSTNGWSSVCNCTGTINAGSALWGLVRNIGLLALASGIIYFGAQGYSTPSRH